MPVAPRALDERFQPTSLSWVASFNRRAEVVFEAQVVLVGADLRRHRLVVAVHVSKASPRRTVTMAEPPATVRNSLARALVPAVTRSYSRRFDFDDLAAGSRRFRHG